MRRRSSLLGVVCLLAACSARRNGNPGNQNVEVTSGLDVINAHERDPAIYVRGIRDAVDAVASGRLDPQPLYTHRFPLDRLDEALNATRDRPDGFLKALVML